MAMANRIVDRQGDQGDQGDGRGRAGAWRQPVVWLALLIFVATLAGCMAMILLAVRLTDPADAPIAGQTIMKMPVERQSPGLPAAVRQPLVHPEAPRRP